MSSDPASLDRLHDLVVPPPVSWWPPAPGWYWVLGTILVLAIYGAVRLFIRWQKNRYRREALAECRKLTATLASPASRIASLTGLSIILKRTALTAFPRPKVASLTGSSWRSFLNRSGAMRDFDSEAGQLLERAAYGQISEDEIIHVRATDAATLVHRWISHHRTDPKDEGTPPC